MNLSIRGSRRCSPEFEVYVVPNEHEDIQLPPSTFIAGVLAGVDTRREGKIQYSQSGPRNPDKGSADCSSTVQWAIKKAGGPDIGGNTGAQG